jgi:hypothetical protein
MESANPDLKHPQAAFAEPLPYGYVYVGMTVDPPGRAPFVRRSASAMRPSRSSRSSPANSRPSRRWSEPPSTEPS